MSNYYNVNPFRGLSANDLNAYDLNHYFAGRKCHVSSSNIQNAENFTFHFTVLEEIHCSSAEHSVWKCFLTFSEPNPRNITVVMKFKRIGDEIFLLSEQHARIMEQNYRLVAKFVKDFEFADIRPSQYLIMAVEGRDNKYYVWLEEYLENFQKFLMDDASNNRDINSRLSLSRSRRVQRLQAAMIAKNESPLIDAQGAVIIRKAYDENGKFVEQNILVLSDIETASTLQAKFNQINDSACRAILTKQFGSNISSQQKSVCVLF